MNIGVFNLVAFGIVCFICGIFTWEMGKAILNAIIYNATHKGTEQTEKGGADR